VDSTQARLTPSEIAFGAVQTGDLQTLPLTLKNVGILPLSISRVRFALGASGNSAAFKVRLNGIDYSGSASTVVRTISAPIQLVPGAEVVATVMFQPQEEQLDAFDLEFYATDEYVGVPVSGLGGHSGDPFLHVVMDGPRWIIDYDEDGSETLVMDGTGSHTHEPGHSLIAYEWRVDDVVESTTTALVTTLSQPSTPVQLTIFDDNVPSHSLTGSLQILVAPPDDVPGVLVTYYDASATGASALLDAALPAADFLEQREGMYLAGAGQVGGSPFTAHVLVRMVGRLEVQELGNYTFTATGGSGRRLLIDGVAVTGPVFLTVGEHAIEARFAVDTLANLPLDVSMEGATSSGSIPSSLLSHDVTGVAPVILGMTTTGAIAGGDPITITGFGFFPPEQVVVHWGSMDLIADDFTSSSPEEITFLSPPGGGAIAVSVETANGTSNAKTFLYQLSGPPPILFKRELILSITGPTAGVWGPDGNLYVASLDGRITRLTFDEDYDLVASTTFTGVSLLSNHETLSLAINPYDPPSPVRLYVGHGDHLVNGGGTPTSFSPYTGAISVLTEPNFDAPVSIVTGLPVSNHDHAINGIAFDNNGDLLISVGSQTNAGVRSSGSGDLPESPLSAAIVKARLSKPGFNGAVTYVETATGLPNDDQRYGDLVDVAPGVDVELHASGLRNAYGLVYTTQGRLYATDNGPNIGFGPASTGPTTQSTDPYDDDELNLIEWGNYYGSANRNRGRGDSRQNVYYAGFRGPSSIPNTLFQMISWLPPSSDGIDEYRANTFQGQMRGNLIVQEYQSRLRRVSLKPDGRGVLGQAVLEPNPVSLGCVVGPGGAIISLDWEHSEVEVFEPDDLTPIDFVVHDIFPWRAPATGGTPFVISGRGLGTLGTTTVLIGGKPAPLTQVTWGRIRGTIPAEASPTTALLDVVVMVGPQVSTLPAAFRYLLGAGNEPGRWEALTSVGTAVGEVAAAVIDGKMYLVGEGTSSTLAFDVQNRQWLAAKAARPFVGHHHAAEAVGGKLYLIGGLDGGAEGRVQIFDPATNAWSVGANMPWTGGSISTAVIGGKIYAAGGIVTAGFTVANCAVYDPATNAWTSKAAMPDQGRNHAAAGTDGSKLYVFGGRRGGNFQTNGYDSVMVYDPATDAWTWNGAAGSTLAPLPEARGGMGKAVYLRGEFYVFGGETLDDPDANANHVYDRVDVYRPSTNTWRQEARMPNPRHGIYPVLYQGHLFLAGGGSQSGNAQSTWFDTFTRQ